MSPISPTYDDAHVYVTLRSYENGTPTVGNKTLGVIRRFTFPEARTGVTVALPLLLDRSGSRVSPVISTLFIVATPSRERSTYTERAIVPLVFHPTVPRSHVRY